MTYLFNLLLILFFHMSLLPNCVLTPFKNNLRISFKREAFKAEVLPINLEICIFPVKP